MVFYLSSLIFLLAMVLPMEMIPSLIIILWTVIRDDILTIANISFTDGEMVLEMELSSLIIISNGTIRDGIRHLNFFYLLKLLGMVKRVLAMVVAISNNH